MRSYLGLSLLAIAATPAFADKPIPTTTANIVDGEVSAYWDQSLSGGPGKDGIPSIDSPRFISADLADDWLEGGDKIIGIYINGEARAYPQSVLVWHEIVNDTVGGENVAVTYCPLTGTGIGYKRGETELGVSGRLVNSNLLMYDRHSDSYWPQILGAAAAGPHAGEGLVEQRVFWTRWDNWLARHPDTEVLSRRTGHVRNYRRDPYGGYNPRTGYYAEGSDRIFPVMNENERFDAKREIFGFRTSEEAVAVDMDALAEAGYLSYSGVSDDFLVIYDDGLETAWVFRGQASDFPEDPSAVSFGPSGPSAPGLQELDAVNGFEAMWFAWYAFYHMTVVLDGDE